MLTISANVANAFEAQGMARLRQAILSGWHRRLLDVATRAGEDGRARVIRAIEDASRRNPGLTERQLVMLADIALVRTTPQATRRRMRPR